MSLPILPLAVWQSGTNENSIPANDNALRVEALLRPCLGVANDATGADLDGDVYLVGSAPTGDFAGFDENDIAIFRDDASGTGWYAWAPVNGLTLIVSGVRKIFEEGSTNAWIDDPSVAGGGGGSPGGSDTQVQFNDGGSFGGDSALTFNKTTKVLAQSGALNEAKGANIASAGTTDIGAATGTYVHVTGTTTITALGTVQAGTRRIVVFDGILTLTHNGTSLILPTAANITTAAGDSAIFVSEGSGNWKCAAYFRASGQSVAGGGGLTNWTDGVNSSAPNATVPVVSLTATNAASVVDAAIVPKSTGGFALAVADNGTGGGNKRGASSVDLQLVRGSNTQVASGARAFIGAGFNNTASGQAAGVVAGESVNISGQKSFGTGTSNTVSGNNSAAIAGTSANVSGANSIALAGGSASANSSNVSGLGANDNSVTGARARAPFGGSPQEFDAILYGQTTNATPLTLTTNASTAAATNQIYFGNQNNRSGIYRGLVVARQTGNGGGKKSWQFYAHLDRDNNTVALVGAVTPTVVADSGVAWSVAVTADNTLKTLKVEATGAAATTINWACYVDGQEVAGA